MYEWRAQDDYPPPPQGRRRFNKFRYKKKTRRNTAGETNVSYSKHPYRYNYFRSRIPVYNKQGSSLISTSESLGGGLLHLLTRPTFHAFSSVFCNRLFLPATIGKRQTRTNFQLSTASATSAFLLQTVVIEITRGVFLSAIRPLDDVRIFFVGAETLYNNKSANEGRVENSRRLFFSLVYHTPPNNRQWPRRFFN